MFKELVWVVPIIGCISKHVCGNESQLPAICFLVLDLRLQSFLPLGLLMWTPCAILGLCSSTATKTLHMS